MQQPTCILFDGEPQVTRPTPGDPSEAQLLHLLPGAVTAVASVLLNAAEETFIRITTGT